MVLPIRRLQEEILHTAWWWHAANKAAKHYEPTSSQSHPPVQQISKENIFMCLLGQSVLTTTVKDRVCWTAGCICVEWEQIMSVKAV